MRQRVDLTTDMLYSLEKIAAVNSRTLEEQILHYLHLALDIDSLG